MGNTPEHSLIEDLQSTIDAHGLQISEVLGQARQFTTVSGLAFGFLLNIAATSGGEQAIPRVIGRTLISLALISTASAILIFALPAIYTQIRFPMDKKQILRFYVWSHRFILYGIVFLSVGLYSAVWFALDRLIILDWPAPILATGIFVIPLTVYRLRKIGGPIELA
jgi:hypothetical protein